MPFLFYQHLLNSSIHWFSCQIADFRDVSVDLNDGRKDNQL